MADIDYFSGTMRDSVTSKSFKVVTSVVSTLNNVLQRDKVKDTVQHHQTEYKKERPR